MGKVRKGFRDGRGASGKSVQPPAHQCRRARGGVPKVIVDVPKVIVVVPEVIVDVPKVIVVVPEVIG